MLVEVEHPTLGPVTLTGVPVKLSSTPGAVRKAPPVVGEDNDRVYGDLWASARPRSTASVPRARSDLRFAPFERYWLGGWMNVACMVRP